MTSEPPPTILIVEDNPITRKLLRITLESEGYRVVEAGDGGAALAVAREKMPALVVQDLVLPDIDGVDLAVELRALPNGGAALPIVALSGLTGTVGEAQIARGGFSAMLVNPLSRAASSNRSLPCSPPSSLLPRRGFGPSSPSATIVAC
jgi:CheY-like chemotaxis protein